MDEYRVDPPNESSVGLGCQVNYGILWLYGRYIYSIA